LSRNFKNELNKILNGIFFPLMFVLSLWLIHFVLSNLHLHVCEFGLIPRTTKGTFTAFSFHLVHGSWSHLISNTIPLLFLGSVVFYFYRSIAFHVFFWVYFMTGVWLWAAARDGTCHVGASGLVYGFVSFIFFSGIFRKNRSLLVISLLVVFLYGSLIWGIFPFNESISWEGHLLGSLSGIITAYFYKKEGPPHDVHHWDEDDNEPETGNEYWREGIE
jgi:membrane associated rhomboid family serine protease